jgi:type II secretory pathway component PulK
MQILLVVLLAVTVIFYLIERCDCEILREQAKRADEERERMARELEHLAGMTRAVVKQFRERFPHA